MLRASLSKDSVSTSTRQVAPRHSIRTRMLSFFLVFTVCFSSVSIIAATYVSRESILQSYHSSVDSILSQSKLLIDDCLYGLLSQMIALVDDSSLNSILLSLAQDPSLKLKAKAYIDIDQSLSNIYKYNYKLLDSIAVYLNDGREVFYKGRNGLFEMSFPFQEWYERYGNADYHWLNYHELDGIRDRGGPRKVFSLFHLLGTPDAGINGIIMFNICREYFDGILGIDHNDAESFLALFSGEGISVFNSEESDLPIALKEIIMSRDEPRGQLRFELDHEFFMVFYDTLTTTHWRIASIVSESDLFSGVSDARNTLLLIGMAFSVLSMLIAALFARHLVDPLRKLASQVSKIGTDTVSFDVVSDDEIGALNDGLERMLLRINELNQRVRTEMDQKRIAEISILQAQIQPHFLYNTLYDIQQLCVMEDTDTAADMVDQLARFYRIGVSRGKNRIPLQDELGHVESYLNIQHLRYPDVFNYEISSPVELMDAPVLGLTLQPLVENALYHGVKKRPEPGGLIRILAREDNGDLLLTVWDNGVGIAEEDLILLCQELKDGFSGVARQSYGLRNVHTRLRLQFGENYGLTLESEEGNYCAVTARLPLVLEEREKIHG